ncbi:hypothetical protein INP57_25685 [Saccharopolyspora sp. HNM0986]|uniref:hypothetical protein n=1 Tax=Saccharopolyspora galaxeae TaxID=2781241 RepID=UPI00190D1446|nr:hypothetical protein [Saccharopolyspora sp. HNM0986]MBK0870207.1 hypothetical protein [Saccharopolyspora sp. HNM0986]
MIAGPPQAQSPRDGEQARVAESYERFWRVSQAVPHHPVEQQRPELASVATESLTNTMLGNLEQQRTRRITLYGHIRPRISEVRIEGSRAVVTDCQDASRSGQADASGQPRTVGLARNPVSSTLHHDADGQWRMVRIDYPGGSC